MPRRATPLAYETAHLTVRCNNKDFLFHLEENFQDIVSWLNCLPLFFSVSLHHVLFMSNHIHMLVTPKENNLGLAMSYFLSNLSKFLNYKNKRVNHTFGNRYYPTVILNTYHFSNVIRYIYQNPVYAGLVEDIRDYPYSSLSQYLGESQNGIVFLPDEYTSQIMSLGIKGRSLWLDEMSFILSDDDKLQIHKCLSRGRFKFSQRQYIEISKNGTSLRL